MELGEFACGEIPTKSVISCLLTPFSVIVSAMLGDIWQSIPQIIKEAATSPLGLLALMIVALAILAFYFFRDAGVPIRVTIFILLFAAVVVFAAKVAYKANEVVAAEKPLSKPVPSSSKGTPNENADQPTSEGNSDESSSQPTVGTEDLDQMIVTINELQMRGLSELFDESTGVQRLSKAYQTFEEAENLLTRAEKNAPGDIQLLELRGYMFKDSAMLSQEQSRPEEVQHLLANAEETFNAVLKRRPSASAYNGLGSVYMLRGDLDRAEKEIRSALELVPDYGPAKQDLQQIEDFRKRKNLKQKVR